MRRSAAWFLILALAPVAVPPAGAHEILEPPCSLLSPNGVTRLALVFPGGTAWVGVTGVAGRELWTLATTQTPLVTLHWVLRPVPYVNQSYQSGPLDAYSPVLMVDGNNPHETLCLEVHNPTTELVTVTMGFRSFAASQ